MKKKVTSGNLVDFIMSYEAGKLSDRDTIKLFKYLKKTRLAYSLQGHYGRQLRILEDAGLV